MGKNRVHKRIDMGRLSAVPCDNDPPYILYVNPIPEGWSDDRVHAEGDMFLGYYFDEHTARHIAHAYSRGIREGREQLAEEITKLVRGG